MSDFLFWPARRLVGAIGSGELSAVEVITAHLEQIAAVNPHINAVVQLATERALEEARACDAMTAKGQSRGPLHGVPMTIKDSLDTEGIISTGGTMGRKNCVPERDAPVVARLRAAGAILLGKTNTPELTLSGETDNLIYGRTNNPYDLTRSPGGSSGASAAIIAAGGAALEIGSDTGGSIREPAHYCGIAGLKPTSGRTPRTGHIVPYGLGAVDSLTQLGPMARFVDDLALALPVICGPDFEDPSCVPMPIGDPGKVDLKSLRIATYIDNGVLPVGPEIAETMAQAVDALRGDGLSVSEFDTTVLGEAAEVLAQLRAADGGTIVRRLLERYGTEEPGPHMTYCFRGPPAVSGDVYCQILEHADQVRSRMLGLLRDVDVILCPAAQRLAPPHGSTLADTFLMWSYCTVYNLTGWPGAVVRAGADSNGLPIGVQCVAAPWREDIALALAARVESLLGGYHRPPSVK